MNLAPPIHVTGDPTLDWLVLAAGALLALYWLRALRLAREGARRFLANVVKSGLVFVVSDVALSGLFNLDHSRAQGLSMCAAFIALVIWQSRKRSRYIPKSVRQAVIERDLPSGGYDPKVHHIDHIWPYRTAPLPPLCRSRAAHLNISMFLWRTGSASPAIAAISQIHQDWRPARYHRRVRRFWWKRGRKGRRGPAGFLWLTAAGQETECPARGVVRVLNRM